MCKIIFEELHTFGGKINSKYSKIEGIYYIYIIKIPAFRIEYSKIEVELKLLVVLVTPWPLPNSSLLFILIFYTVTWWHIDKELLRFYLALCLVSLAYVQILLLVNNNDICFVALGAIHKLRRQSWGGGFHSYQRTVSEKFFGQS